MRILLWHVHGSWTTSFVQGGHTYLVPVTADRGPDGRGRAQTWEWPETVREVPLERLREEPVDVVVLQRVEEIALVQAHLGRTPGRDVPAVYVEHNTPRGAVPFSRHPLADQADIRLVHVTGFNELMWDSGAAPTTVIEHGIVDPGQQYTGELDHLGVVVNDPVRRGRAVGADLFDALAAIAPLDVFGMRVDLLSGAASPDRPRHDITPYEDLPQPRMHAELARRRVYIHPVRWTSLGLSLIEAMHLGMPIVALGVTEAPEAIPPGTGIVTTRLDTFLAAVRWLVSDAEAAGRMGDAARAAALGRYGLKRFLHDWDALLAEVTS
jgi:hypothetical protein